MDQRTCSLFQSAKSDHVWFHIYMDNLILKYFTALSKHEITIDHCPKTQDYIFLTRYLHGLDERLLGGAAWVGNSEKLFDAIAQTIEFLYADNSMGNDGYRIHNDMLVSNDAINLVIKSN